jgi:membrane protein implicated in regulation of membrane protease activity
MEWIGDNPWLVWVAIALVLAAIEAATVDFVFVMLAGGALASAVAAAFGAGMALQIVVGVVVAVALLLVARPWLKRKFNENDVSNTIGAPSLVGRSARVLQTVTENDGRVKLAGETWSARVPAGSPACQPGQEVRVVSIEGATVIVTGVTAGQKTE